MTIEHYEPHRMVHAGMLRVGDLVDLEGGLFADPDGTDPALQFEYAVVCEISRETEDCIAIGFEGLDIIGFPPGHILLVGGHDGGYDEEVHPHACPRCGMTVPDARGLVPCWHRDCPE